LRPWPGCETIDSTPQGGYKFQERKRLGLSAAKYGELVGVSMLTIYNWEKGVLHPPRARLEKWLAVKGIGKGKAEKMLGLG